MLSEDQGDLFRVDCVRCGKPIEARHQATALMVRRTLDADQGGGRFEVDEGPFHFLCGRAQADVLRFVAYDPRRGGWCAFEQEGPFSTTSKLLAGPFAERETAEGVLGPRLEQA